MYVLGRCLFPNAIENPPSLHYIKQNLHSWIFSLLICNFYTMKSPRIISLFCSCMLLSHNITTLSPALALEDCEFPAIFNFGDSNSDTGGLSSSLYQAPPPYGDTYFHKPAGRFSDGRLIIDFLGGIFASLMPKEEYFSKALYTFDIGQNDLGKGFFDNQTIQEVNASVPDIMSKFSTNIKKIYDLGARSFWIHNTGPIGCLPYVLADEVGCAKSYNEVAQHFNHKLREAIVQLRKDLPLATFTYVDVYSVKYSLYKEPKRYGFELPLVACCGYGGKYNFNSSAECGGTVAVNGSQIFVGSCKRPSARVNWDGIHYTEAAAKFVFDKISTGAFSDPPFPLKQACHRSLD